jgi:uncharacterized protein YkwD
MSRPLPALLASLTLLILAPLASPTAALGSAHAGIAHAAKHGVRTTRHAPSRRSRAVRRTSTAGRSRGVTRTHTGTRHQQGSRATTTPRHRTRGFRGVHPGATSTPVKRATPLSGKPAAIAAVLAASCQNTELTPTPGNVDVVRGAVLCLVNRVRAQNGEAPLALSAQLQQAADGHSSERVSADYFEHVSPSGVTPVDRIRATGYIPGTNVGYVIGENLAWGTLNLATPQSIVSAWIASPGHLANILEAQYTDTGIGVTPQVPPSLSGGEAGATYAQEFGVIVH